MSRRTSAAICLSLDLLQEKYASSRPNALTILSTPSIALVTESDLRVPVHVDRRVDGEELVARDRREEEPSKQERDEINVLGLRR